MYKKILILVITILFMIGIKTANAISITDYRVPVSSATSAFGGFGYTYASDNTGTKTADKGNVSADYSQFYSSLPFGYRFGLKGIATRDGLDTLSEYTYNLTGSAQANKYLLEGMDLFGFGKVDVAAAKAYDRPGVNIAAGLGYGRFINATPLARAVRVQEELRKEGVLTEDMFDSNLIELAKILAPEVMQKYKQEYDYWERNYYKDVEDVLKKSGRLRDDELGSVGTLVINDVLDEFISNRYYGYEASAGIGYELLTPYKDDERDVFVEVNFNSAYPLNLRSQFIEFFTLRTPLTGGKFGKEITFSLSPSFSYEVSNNLDFIATYILNGNKYDIEDSELELNHGLSLTLAYYIVNRLILNNTFTLSKSHGAEKIAVSFTTGIIYRLY